MAKWQFRSLLGKKAAPVPLAQASSDGASVFKRFFTAGQFSRILEGFRGTTTTINASLWGELEPMRARSRTLANNNNHARRFIQMCCTHIVGQNGFLLSVQAKKKDKTDKKTNDLIETHFDAWARRGVCETTGKLSFVGVKHLVIKTIARDGEALVRKVRGDRAGNPYGFALRVLAMDRLAIGLNGQTKDGNVVRMGVESDEDGRPIAYHLETRNPADLGFGFFARKTLIERVPAEDIYHLFLPLEPEQVRGVPWMHTAMETLHHLQTFHDAALIAASVGAAKMGFLTTEDGTGIGVADGKDASGNLTLTQQAGQIDTLPPGVKFTSYEPAYPEANYGPFVKAFLQAAASGLGVSYSTFANDLEGVSYSSIRSGVLEERDNWMVLQNWFAEAFLQEVYRDWLKAAFLSSAIKDSTGKPLSINAMSECLNHKWQGRRWAWVDPLRDIEATVKAIDNGLMSRTEAAAQQGRELEDVWEQLSKEQQEASKINLSLPVASGIPQPTIGQEDNTA